jgi:ABC-type lipoprotein release transport system permease subunit
MERSVKERVLGFSPHILMSFHPDGGQSEPLESWREPAKKFASVPGVKSATPFVAESVILDFVTPPTIC